MGGRFRQSMVFVSFFCILSADGISRVAPDDLNVLLVTWDGVRPQEIFGDVFPTQTSKDRNLLPYFWQRLVPAGHLWGDTATGTAFVTANDALLSLPGYQSIFAGRHSYCPSNDCERIPEETLAERIVRELGLVPSQVATIASWKKIGLAVESKVGSTSVDAGPASNAQAVWPEARSDAETFASAMKYLRTERPRFLFLSLNDSDEWAHLNRWDKYTAALSAYDGWLAELDRTLSSLGSYGRNTVLLVTTDHGRGGGPDWPHHGSDYPSARSIWLYLRLPSHSKFQVDRASQSSNSHLDIRPTIETLFGLEATTCVGCGKSLVIPMRREVSLNR